MQEFIVELFPKSLTDTDLAPALRLKFTTTKLIPANEEHNFKVLLLEILDSFAKVYEGMGGSGLKVKRIQRKLPDGKWQDVDFIFEL